jgi:tetratricopeptide (TPR) repeat protein
MKQVAWLFSVVLLSISTSTLAQSPHNDAVVSVQDLALSGKAVTAFMKGTELLTKGDAAGSVEHFLKAIELAPSSYRPYHNLALAQFRLGQLDAAADDFQKSIDLTKGAFAPSLFGLSMILYKRAEFLNARLLIDRGLAADPASAVGKYCLALVQYSLGQIPEAERSALDARNGDVDAYVLLARIHERTNKPTAVLDDVRAYLKLSPKGGLRSQALDLLGRAQLQLGPQSASLH